MQLALPSRLGRPESFQYLLDLVPAGIVLVDSAGTIRSVNCAAAELFGYEPGELAAVPIRTLVPEGVDVTVVSAEHRCHASGLRKDGTGLSLRITSNPVEDDDSGLFLCLVEEVLESPRGDGRLSRLTAALDQASDGILITDSDGRAVYVNAALEALTGLSATEMLGETPTTLQLSHPSAETIWTRLRAGERWTGQLDFTRDDDSAYVADVSVSPILDAAGTLTGVVEIRRDRTEDLSLQEQLAQSQKLEAVGQLAAGIAHEINTPIQFIGDNLRFLSDGMGDLMSLVGLLQRASAPPADGPSQSEILADAARAIEEADVDFLVEEVPRAIDQSLEGVDRVAAIVRAMKEYSHPAEERAATDINAAIQSTATVARAEWKYVADLVTDFDTDLPLVICSVGEFNQVILNMLVNAAHAISDVVGDGATEKGTITIRTRRSDSGVVITMSDTGNGMPPEVQARVFDPFFTTKDVGKGTGQGLSLAHTIIVKKHNGALEVDSTQGEGTTFTIRLPWGSPDEEEETP